MKSAFIKPLVVIALFTVFSFSVKQKKLIPPGTVEVNDTLFFDATEISNFSWREYVSWNEKVYGRNSVQYKNSLPDTTVWRNSLSYNEPYVTYYYQHVAYRNYPVVGISYEQALDYCNWRTKVVNTAMMVKAGKLKWEADLNIEPEIKCEYRLPTKTEWEAMSLLGFNEKTQREIAKKKTPPYNLINTYSPEGVSNDNADVTAPTYSYYGNLLGIYNLTGNVAEMTSTKGICKGGSWRHTLQESNSLKDIPYETPKAWLGFRCVCIVKK